MTDTQQALYTKFLAKAIADDLHVIGHGTIRATGQRFIAVSASKGDGVYTVTIAGHDLHCNCPAGTNGHYCKHRALARQSIETKAAAQAASMPPPIEATVAHIRCEYGHCDEAPTVLVHIPGCQYSERMCAYHAAKHFEIYQIADAERETAPMALKDNSKRFLRQAVR